MAVIFLGLGTNLGSREENLSAAREQLVTKLRMLRTSSVYETEPWGFREQPAFLNQVVQAETDLRPHQLLRFLKRLEKRLGRVTSWRSEAVF